MTQKLDLRQARALVDAMLAAAEARGLKMAAAVTDAGGDLLAMARMDGASALNARMSHHKAYTAVKWQRDTREIRERLFDMSLGNERREISWFGDPLYTPVWGGLVLRAEDESVLGAIGESGGSPQQDEEIGQIGRRLFEGR